MMKRQLMLAIAVLAVLLLCAYNVYATDTEYITATAQITTLNPEFSISLFESLSATTYDWANPQPPSAGMNFGTLDNADPSDATSALAASKHFLVLVGVITNSGNQYAVKYTGAPLAKVGEPSMQLAEDAWTIAADVHYDPDTAYPAGVTYGVNSAENTYVVYTSDVDGNSDTIRLYFGITGDPNDAAGPDLIPPTQEAGTYTGTVKLEVYAL